MTGRSDVGTLVGEAELDRGRVAVALGWGPIGEMLDREVGRVETASFHQLLGDGIAQTRRQREKGPGQQG